MADKKDEFEIVGYVNVGAFEFVCMPCGDLLRPKQHKIKVCRINVEPYKQTCHCCKSVVVEGLLNTELFSPKDKGE